MKFADAIKGVEYKEYGHSMDEYDQKTKEIEPCDNSYVVYATVDRHPGDALSDAIEKAINKTLYAIEEFDFDVLIVRASPTYNFLTSHFGYEESKELSIDGYSIKKGLNAVISPKGIALPHNDDSAKDMENAIIEAIASVVPHQGERIILTRDVVGAKITVTEDTLQLEDGSPASLTVKDFTVNYALVTDHALCFFSKLIETNSISAIVEFYGIPDKEVVSEEIEVTNVREPIRFFVNDGVAAINEKLKSNLMTLADIKAEFLDLVEKAKADAIKKVGLIGTDMDS